MKGNLRLSKEVTGSGSIWDSDKSKALTLHCDGQDFVL